GQAGDRRRRVPRLGGRLRRPGRRAAGAAARHDRRACTAHVDPLNRSVYCGRLSATVRIDMSTATETSLAAPLTLPSGRILQNRMMKAALSEGLAEESGAPGSRLRQLYSRWAEGRYGLVVTGNVMVDGRHLGEPGNVVV